MPSPVVVAGATCMCTGAVPPGQSAFGVGSQSTCLAEGKPIMTIQDISPAAVPPFGMCMSMANPAVQAATSAALGVLTPVPCTPALAGPWQCQNSNMLVGGLPALTIDGKAVCSIGAGNISILNAGQNSYMA